MLDSLVGIILIIVAVGGILAGIIGVMFILYAAYHVGQEIADIWEDIRR